MPRRIHCLLRFPPGLYLYLLAVLAALGTSCGSLERERQREAMSAVLGGLTPMEGVTPAGPVSVSLVRDEHHSVPVVLARVNGGAEFPLILDTGGNHTMISAARAERSEVNKIIGRGTITTAFGNHEPSQLAFVQSLQLGGLSLSRVPVLIHQFTSRGTLLGLGSELNVLGTPAMSAFSHITFDYPRQRVIFCHTQNFPEPRGPGVIRLPMHVEKDGHLTVPLRLSGQPTARAVVDTGYDGVLLLNAAMVERLGLGDAASRGFKVRAVGPGLAQEGAVFLVPGLDCGGRHFTNVEAWTGSTSEPVLLGSGFLRHFSATFDFHRMVLWLVDAPTRG